MCTALDQESSYSNFGRTHADASRLYRQIGGGNLCMWLSVSAKSVQAERPPESAL